MNARRARRLRRVIREWKLAEQALANPWTGVVMVSLLNITYAAAPRWEQRVLERLAQRSRVLNPERLVASDTPQNPVAT